MQMQIESVPAATPEIWAEEEEWTSSLPVALADDVTEEVEQLSLPRGTARFCHTLWHVIK